MRAVWKWKARTGMTSKKCHYNINMHIIFYGMMLLGNIVRPFHTVTPKTIETF